MSEEIYERFIQRELDVMRGDLASAVAALDGGDTRPIREWQVKFDRVLGHGVTWAEWAAEFGLADDADAEDSSEVDAAPNLDLVEEARQRRLEYAAEIQGPPDDEPPAKKEPYTPSIDLTPGQQAAFDMVMDGTRGSVSINYPYIVKGFAGTGKTTLLREILGALGKPSVLLAPTGKAALRIREATGAHASTIHSWLYAPKEDPRTGEVKFVPKPTSLLEVPASRCIFVDESSMLTAELYGDLHRACLALGVSLVLVGDGFQLPPVAAPGSAPFCALDLAVDAHHHAELTQVMRQAEGSPIIRASMEIRNGRPFDGLKLLHRFGASEVSGAAFNVWRNAGVTIVHRNATRSRLNVETRKRLGYSVSQVAQEKEPLLIMRNTPGIGFNGEVVRFVKWIDEPRESFAVQDKYRGGKEEQLHYGLAELEGGSRVVLCHQQLLGASELSESAIARGFGWRWKRKDISGGEKREVFLHAAFGYTWTAHKSQGSQWPYALVCVEPSVRLKDEDGLRWLYTAVTRAQTTCAYAMGNL